MTLDAATPANICAAASSANFRVPLAAGDGSGNPRRKTDAGSGATMDIVDAFLKDEV